MGNKNSSVNYEALGGYQVTVSSDDQSYTIYTFCLDADTQVWYVWSQRTVKWHVCGKMI